MNHATHIKQMYDRIIAVGLLAFLASIVFSAVLLSWWAALWVALAMVFGAVWGIEVATVYNLYRERGGRGLP